MCFNKSIYFMSGSQSGVSESDSEFKFNRLPFSQLVLPSVNLYSSFYWLSLGRKIEQTTEEEITNKNLIFCDLNNFRIFDSAHSSDDPAHFTADSAHS